MYTPHLLLTLVYKQGLCSLDTHAYKHTHTHTHTHTSAWDVLSMHNRCPHTNSGSTTCTDADKLVFGHLKQNVYDFCNYIGTCNKYTRMYIHCIQPHVHTYMYTELSTGMGRTGRYYYITYEAYFPCTHANTHTHTHTHAHVHAHAHAHTHTRTHMHTHTLNTARGGGDGARDPSTMISRVTLSALLSILKRPSFQRPVEPCWTADCEGHESSWRAPA